MCPLPTRTVTWLFRGGRHPRPARPEQPGPCRSCACDGVLDLDPGYLPSAMTPMPSVLSVRSCLMARYSDDSYQALAAAFVANLSTTVTCPADPSSSSESRSMTMFSAPWAV